MANFKTHLNGAIAVSSIGSIVAIQTQIASPIEGFIFFIFGVVGGILPDIDSDSSIPLKFLSFSFGFMIAFLIILTKVNIYSILELIIAWSVLFLIFHYSLKLFFKKFTKHRGMLHSIPAGVMFATSMAIVLNSLFGFSEFKSWLGALFIFVGFLTHLILDELYSIDIERRKVKKSFGTALKLYSKKDGKSTMILYLITISLIYYSPDTTSFKYILKSDTLYQRVSSNLTPDGVWFEDLQNRVSSNIDKLKSEN